MFLIEVNGKVQLFENKWEDDFLRFLPDFFGCNPEDLKVHFIDHKETIKMHRFLNDDPANFVECGSSGVLTKKKIGKDKKGNDKVDVVETIQGQPLKEWPYDKDQDGKLKFKGHKI